MQAWGPVCTLTALVCWPMCLGHFAPACVVVGSERPQMAPSGASDSGEPTVTSPFVRDPGTVTWFSFLCSLGDL